MIVGEIVPNQALEPDSPDDASRPPRRGMLLPALVYLACLAAFVFDIQFDQTVTVGVLYIPMVGTAVYFNDRRIVWLLAALATAMIVIGFFLPAVNENLVEAVVNRGLSIFVIWTIAELIHQEMRGRQFVAEASRKARSADRVKARLLGHLSHELKTPLNAILGGAELMLADCRPDQRGYLTNIDAAGRRLLGTFENLIDLTRLDEWKQRATRLDLGLTLAAAVERVRAEATASGIAIVTAATFTTAPGLPAREMPSGAGDVWGDSWAIGRILDNLLSNAVKFSPPGSSIAIAVEPQAAESGDFGLDDPRGRRRLVVSVQDQGRGMAKSILNQLGEPFFQADSGAQREFEGLGIGLSLSLRLAAAIGGRLTFESAPGAGTTARLELPAAPAAPETV